MHFHTSDRKFKVDEEKIGPVGLISGLYVCFSKPRETTFEDQQIRS